MRPPPPDVVLKVGEFERKTLVISPFFFFQFLIEFFYISVGISSVYTSSSGPYLILIEKYVMFSVRPPSRSVPWVEKVVSAEFK